MMILMRNGATDEEIDEIVERLQDIGAQAHVSRGEFKTIIGAIGDREKISQIPFEALSGVDSVVAIMKPYKLVSREFHPDSTVVKVGPVEFGGETFVVIAGPCAVESEEQLIAAAKAVKEAGAHMLRGGAFKPRTSPYAFQGLGEEGLKYLALARETTGLPIVTEVMDVRHVELVSTYADMLQIGARNMQNFFLLREVGLQQKPVMLKRGFANTIEDLLMAAEYIVSGGNNNVVLCERGIRTFESATRSTLDLSAVPLVKIASHLPIIVDPSHAAGKRELVSPLSKGALAVGAHGIIVETHPNPKKALCDGTQSLPLDDFTLMMKELELVAAALGRKI
ncbi:MAG: 3-deoxy-7-phosphoheptulonate synthase [Candidatus Anoxymicrobium japonicum]|uniref:3-deoxy-7-phosphoheptulonate synthase n=1 Tax=Candidatus Anoxymicrobium japonicum TaxID=2013648 RepID=A0A2N3G5N1_9ACTN|nr:MAG: 3-deoxy-7-phosphoheptulonate synthase [Candidatus Anoxymicrobium japonicum]